VRHRLSLRIRGEDSRLLYVHYGCMARARAVRRGGSGGATPLRTPRHRSYRCIGCNSIAKVAYNACTAALSTSLEPSRRSVLTCSATSDVGAPQSPARPLAHASRLARDGRHSSVPSGLVCKASHVRRENATSNDSREAWPVNPKGAGQPDRRRLIVSGSSCRLIRPRGSANSPTTPSMPSPSPSPAPLAPTLVPWTPSPLPRLAFGDRGMERRPGLGDMPGR